MHVHKIQARARAPRARSLVPRLHRLGIRDETSEHVRHLVRGSAIRDPQRVYERRNPGMADRKAELEKKRKKLEQLRIAREQKKKETADKDVSDFFHASLQWWKGPFLPLLVLLSLRWSLSPRPQTPARRSATISTA